MVSKQPSSASDGESSVLPSPELASALPTELSKESTTLGIDDLQLVQNWTLEAHKGFNDDIEDET